MAKVSAVEKNKRRRKAVAQAADKRAALKKIIKVLDAAAFIQQVFDCMARILLMVAFSRDLNLLAFCPSPAFSAWDLFFRMSSKKFWYRSIISSTAAITRPFKSSLQKFPCHSNHLPTE